MGRTRYLATNVFEESLHRLRGLYAEGHRLIFAISGGKDSSICLELGILAATMENRLPVECWTRDEEIMLPGTYEYMDWVAHRNEVDFNHFVAYQPGLNFCNRAEPFWWLFDDRLKPDQWVRQPPSYSIDIRELPDIDFVVMPGRFPPADGKELVNVQGLRTQESQGRKLAMLSAGGFLTNRRPRNNVRAAYPIYDWTEKDVWTAFKQFGWRHNEAYNVMYRLGIPQGLRRIGPPTMNYGSVQGLVYNAPAFPEWAERVYARLPGTRNVVRYGVSAITPHRKPGETWQQCFERTCIAEAPAWISERAEKVRRVVMEKYQRIAGNKPFPEVTAPPTPNLRLASWRILTHTMYRGDPFAHRATGIIEVLDPEFFRPGSGVWQDTKLVHEMKQIEWERERHGEFVKPDEAPTRAVAHSERKAQRKPHEFSR